MVIKIYQVWPLTFTFQITSVVINFTGRTYASLNRYNSVVTADQV